MIKTNITDILSERQLSLLNIIPSSQLDVSIDDISVQVHISNRNNIVLGSVYNLKSIPTLDTQYYQGGYKIQSGQYEDRDYSNIGTDT